MIAKGFKPVGWVAAVATAALGCYMLSLQVAAERSELAAIERRILTAQQNIRALQTELGTRGRLSQLEHWNAEVLALSAPAANQFLDSELRLARFDLPQAPAGPEAPVRMASAEIPAVPAPAPAAQAPAADLRVAVARLDQPQPQPAAAPAIRRASVVVGVADEQAETPRPRPNVIEARAPSLLDEGTLRELQVAARTEREGGAGN